MKKEIEAFLQQGQAEGWTEGTTTNHRKKLEQMHASLKTKGIENVVDVKPVHLEAHLKDLFDRGLKKGTRRNAASTIRMFFASLAEHGKLLRNPARYLPVFDDRDNELPEPPLEEDEIARLFASLPRRNVVDYRNILHLELLYGCGLRMNESISLDLKDCNFSDGTVTVRNGKGGKSRVLPMMGGVRTALKDYLALRRSLVQGPDTGALLLSSQGRRIHEMTLRYFIRRINKRPEWRGRRIHPHLLRHSCAVHLHRAGSDVRYISEFLGHANGNLNTLKIYLRLVPGRLKKDYDNAMPEFAISI